MKAGRDVERLLVERRRASQVALVEMPEQSGFFVAVDGLENRAAFFLPQIHRDIESSPVVGVEKRNPRAPRWRIAGSLDVA